MISSSGFSGLAVAGGFQPSTYMMQERGGPSARDVLLLKCKDAIETLHLELEEERTEKERMGNEMSEMQRIIEDL